MRLTGGQILAHYLVREGVSFAVGIPGHGCWAIVDALVDFADRLTILQIMHEQSAVHLADGYYRVKGRPLMAFTSIGPGAVNTAVGVATAYVDSTAVLLITGSPHTYMRGRAVLQEIERTQWANFPRLMEPIVKRYWQVSRVDQLPYVLHRAFNQMLSGRPGPVLIDMPMDVQADDADVAIPEPASHQPQGRPRPDTASVERAARLLVEARRPVLLAGGGVITSDASTGLVALAEHLGAPVVTTWMGKGAIPEDHDLNAWSVGDTASICGNALARSADVLLAVGCRFTDWSASSYRRDVSFSIPPTRLIHVDIDPHEIGKNYPCEIGLVADARAALADLLEAVRQLTPARDYHESPYFREVQRLKKEWEETQGPRRNSNAVPMTQSRAVRELRAALDRSAIVVTGAGLVQGVVRQDFPVYEPRTHLTSGGFSTMGFTVPAAIGAKLAAPERQVAGIAGDGDFLQTMQEMAVAAMLDLPVLFVVLNNAGWISIKGGQISNFGRVFATEFQRRDGSAYTPDYAAAARSFGLHAERVDRPDEVLPTAQRALATGGPALVEISVARDFPDAGATKTGWWDVPVPTYHRQRRRRYEAERAEEQI
jgi:acetolactate synthase-1/2/3 large subunit